MTRYLPILKLEKTKFNRVERVLAVTNGNGKAQGADLGLVVTDLLDRDKDGSIGDDLLDMASQLFGGGAQK